jgi:hypothetical protein
MWVDMVHEAVDSVNPVFEVVFWGFWRIVWLQRASGQAIGPMLNAGDVDHQEKPLGYIALYSTI